MRGAGVNTNGLVNRGLAELNHHRRDEQREVRGGIANDGHGLSEEDESRNNEDAGYVNGGPIKVVHAQSVPDRPQQQPQGPVVRWERFLPLRSLMVLLVENDDSTRHVVSALLRNCSYEVTAVANGLEAWKILEDITSRIDLVLTEVVLPSLSGIGLLTKIVSRQSCKNVPVIMMSSNDSMGIVFKCLSKGAVDFLVKPIRKNELKNLWQHVWRKCHSSSISGSESGIRTIKSTNSKSVKGSGNNADSNNDEDDDESIGLNAKDGSESASGTQSSWSKRVVEVDSSQAMSPWGQLADPPDGTCALVIHSRTEIPSTTDTGCEEKGVELDNVAMGKDLEIGVPRNPDLKLDDLGKTVLNSAGAKEDMFSDLGSRKDDEKLGKGRLTVESETLNGECRKKAVDLMAFMDNCNNPKKETVANEFQNDLPKITNIKDKGVYNAKELPSLELSLKRLRDVGDTGTSIQEQKVLRHSAFSRYNTVSIANQAPTGNVGSCSPVDNSSGATKTDSIHNLQSNSNSAPNQRSNGSSNDDMGSSTNNAFTKPEAVNNEPVPRSTVNVYPRSAFQPVQHGHPSSIQSPIQGKADATTTNIVLAQTGAKNQQFQVHYHHHHYHHHHHHVHNTQHEQELPNDDDLTTRNTVATDSDCGTSNLLTAPTEGNAANYSLNGSASVSNNGSNELIAIGAENCNSIPAEGKNVETENGVAGSCGAFDGSSSGSRSGVDQNRLAQREAALNKFRQKRKDRCFEKKVRYHSRKKLAEQRPRVKGQFVRQAVKGNIIEDLNS